MRKKRTRRPMPHKGLAGFLFTVYGICATVILIAFIVALIRLGAMSCPL